MLWLIKTYLLHHNVIRKPVLHGGVFRHGFRGHICARLCFFFGLWFFFCLLQEPADIADFLHTVYREACVVLKRDVTHGNIAADFPDALYHIAAVVNHKLFADKVRIILHSICSSLGRH